MFRKLTLKQGKVESLLLSAKCAKEKLQRGSQFLTREETLSENWEDDSEFSPVIIAANFRDKLCIANHKGGMSVNLCKSECTNRSEKNFCWPVRCIWEDVVKLLSASVSTEPWHRKAKICQ